MMRVLVFSILLMSSVSANAATQLRTAVKPRPAPVTRWEFYPLNLHARFETGEQQSLVPRAAMGLALGAQLGRQSLLLEAGTFKTRTGNAFANIEREHQEVLMWLRTDVLANRNWAATAGAGLGFMRETAQTRIDGMQTNDGGAMDAGGGVSVGGLFKTKTLRLALEGRLIFGQSLQPNPQPDVVLRTGFAF
jgi:hypothetical protein